MATTDNLKKGISFDKRTEDELREITKKAGNNSGRSRALKAIANKFGSYKVDKDTLIKLIGEEMVAQGYELTYDEAMLIAQYRRAIDKGDTRAAEYLSKIKGEMIIKTENVHDVDGSLERLNGILRQKDATTNTDIE